MSEHSPGPWYLHVNAADYAELRSSNGDILAQWGTWPILSEADARLIAAAPEMLALLREVGATEGTAIACLGIEGEERLRTLLARLDKP